jgi:hypothetical protein
MKSLVIILSLFLTAITTSCSSTEKNTPIFADMKDSLQMELELEIEKVSSVEGGQYSIENKKAYVDSTFTFTYTKDLLIFEDNNYSSKDIEMLHINHNWDNTNSKRDGQSLNDFLRKLKKLKKLLKDGVLDYDDDEIFLHNGNFFNIRKSKENMTEYFTRGVSFLGKKEGDSVKGLLCIISFLEENLKTTKPSYVTITNRNTGVSFKKKAT